MPSIANSGDWTFTRVIVVGLWLSFIIFVGVVGNILVIIVSLQGTRVRTRGKSLIVSMACADLLQSVNMIFMLITAASYGQWILGDVMCTLHGFVNTMLITVSIFSLMAVSINRYFIVVKPHVYKQVFKKRNEAIIIMSAWLASALLAMPPLTGSWSRYEFQTNKGTCLFYFSTSMAYSISLMAIVVPGPMVVIMFCCYKIFIQVRQHQTRVQVMATRNTTNIEEIRITKTLIVIIMSYLICFIPAAVVNLIEMVSPHHRIQFWIDVVTMNLVFLNHANNPVIYGFFNKQYRIAFKELFIRLFPGQTLFRSSREATQESWMTNAARRPENDYSTTYETCDLFTLQASSTIAPISLQIDFPIS